MFVNQLSAQFPNLEFLATTLPSTALNPAYKKSKQSSVFVASRLSKLITDVVLFIYQSISINTTLLLGSRVTHSCGTTTPEMVLSGSSANTQVHSISFRKFL